MSGAAGRRPDPIPFTILTGFLGVGKTTLLNRLLRDPALADTLVIVNEFGEVGLDHLLVESATDEMVLLSAGCVCCTVRGDLVSTLEDLLRRRDNGRMPPFRRVIVETTGLADPVPVLAAVLYHPYLSLRFAVTGVVTLVDALGGAGLLARHAEARRQVATADEIVLSKTDLGGEAERAALVAALRALAPAARLHEAATLARPADLLSGGLFDLDGKIADVAAWLGAARERPDEVAPPHPAGLDTFALAADRPITSGALDMFLDLVRSTFGPRILRLKGLVDIMGQPGPTLVHGVAHVLHVPAVLPAWPDEDRTSRLVFIVDGVPRHAVEKLWHAFTGIRRPDAPDAAALTDNPLAPPTLARTG